MCSLWSFEVASEVRDSQESWFCSSALLLAHLARICVTARRQCKRRCDPTPGWVASEDMTALKLSKVDVNVFSWKRPTHQLLLARYSALVPRISISYSISKRPVFLVVFLSLTSLSKRFLLLCVPSSMHISFHALNVLWTRSSRKTGRGQRLTVLNTAMVESLSKASKRVWRQCADDEEPQIGRGSQGHGMTVVSVPCLIIHGWVPTSFNTELVQAVMPKTMARHINPW